MEERAVPAGSLSLATKAWLHIDAPCVVLVHGLGTNLDHWGSVVPLLRDWCTVIAFDRRGHGRSSTAQNFDATDLADDIAAIVDAYDVVDPILVGHSIGAWDCLTYGTRSTARAIICLDQAIASEDSVWRGSLNPQDSPDDVVEPGYTDVEIADQMAQGRAELGERLWRETYGPMNDRALSRRPDGRLYYRPDSQTLRAIRSGWGSFVAGGEPYDLIDCRVVVALAERNTGPIHDALRRVVVRHGLETVSTDTGHDIHVQQPQLVADLVRSVSPNGPV